ncbi:MAG: Hint domain-containing protein [Sulfitobacter sp.]
MSVWKSKSALGLTTGSERSDARHNGMIPVSHGLSTGTRVASNLGWRAVEALAVGDSVLTFDNNMQKIVAIRQTALWVDATDVPMHQWPVYVPLGVLGNRTDLTLLPEQGVMVESQAAMDVHGDPFAVIPAEALDGFHGIFRCPPDYQTTMITLYFENEEVIYTEGGFLVHCPRPVIQLDDMLSDRSPTYEVLNMHDATFLVECLDLEDQMGDEYTQSVAMVGNC